MYMCIHKNNANPLRPFVPAHPGVHERDTQTLNPF